MKKTFAMGICFAALLLLGLSDLHRDTVAIASAIYLTGLLLIWVK